MAYLKSQMYYDDYQWNADADHDNPYYKSGKDYSGINKSEGYEVLYFLNHLGKKIFDREPSVEVYQKMEKILKNYVPPKSTHYKAEYFIMENWKKYYI